MKIIGEFDFINDRHTELGTSPDCVYIAFSSGDKIKLSWEHAKAISSMVERIDKRKKL